MVVPPEPWASNDRAGADGLSTKLNRIFPVGSCFSSGISGRFATEYVIDPVNCDGHWIAAGKRQFERLVERLRVTCGSQQCLEPLDLVDRADFSRLPCWHFLELELQELAEKVRAEEKQVEKLDSWVTSWLRANQYRDFIAALEDTWTRAGHDLSPEAEKGKRIIWMKQQADRLDPLIDSPPSILDRKHELGHRWY